ncbi:hypothetical protein IW249_002267 [Micromonospora vinacea]|uniref:Uncharacterized protein n=1 Tax=Micromonospora vinacea TaxID=709878 RepID=A0ABS0JZR3_9ACTN|nr:hypothetical protein [Micromonospora vinacea]
MSSGDSRLLLTGAGPSRRPCAPTSSIDVRGRPAPTLALPSCCLGRFVDCARGHGDPPSLSDQRHSPHLHTCPEVTRELLPVAHGPDDGRVTSSTSRGAWASAHLRDRAWIAGQLVPRRLGLSHITWRSYVAHQLSDHSELCQSLGSTGDGSMSAHLRSTSTSWPCTSPENVGTHWCSPLRTAGHCATPTSGPGLRADCVVGRAGRCDSPRPAAHSSESGRGGWCQCEGGATDEAFAARGADYLRTGTTDGGVIDLGKRRSPGR